MNIQIYGRQKCFDTKKAMRHFKERKIPFQLVEIDRFSLGKRELETVSRACGLFNLLNEKSPLFTSLNLDKIASSEMISEIARENPKVFKTPIVRNGNDATVGYQKEVWDKWQ